MQESNTSVDFECFQNFTSSEVIVHQLAGLINQSDITGILKNQKLMLQRFEKTNEMLINFNNLSQNRLKNVTEDYRKHCKALVDMRKDLDFIFKKIRTIKGKLENKYPESFKRQNMQNLDEDEKEVDVEEENINFNYEQLESISSSKQIDNAYEASD